MNPEPMKGQLQLPGDESLEAQLSEVAKTAPDVPEDVAELEAEIAEANAATAVANSDVDDIDVGAAVRRLVQKAENWVLMQPEYPLVFLMSRPARRRFSRELAKILTTIPKRRGVGG